MYFGLCRISFTAGSRQVESRKDISSLMQKIRRRYNVCIKSSKKRTDSNPEIHLALLNENSQKLNQSIDNILEYCEANGFGRIEVETSIVDHFDTLID